LARTLLAKTASQLRWALAVNAVERGRVCVQAAGAEIQEWRLRKETIHGESFAKN
jgi:hypothetical protein